MSLARWMHTRLDQRNSRGLAVRLRHAFPHPLSMSRALFTDPLAPAEVPRRDERIVVVGTGPAAVACLRELKAARFNNVEIVSRDGGFGGKCVSVGCMPIEYGLALPQQTELHERAGLIERFVAELSADIAQQVGATGYGLHQAVAIAAEDRRLLLADGTALPFDRLILAMGSDYLAPPWLPPDAANVIDIAGFWKLRPGDAVTIFAQDNPACLSLADIALWLGLRPVFLLAGRNPLGQLPSFRHFIRMLQRRGVTIHDGVRIRHLQGGQITFETKGKSQNVAAENLLVLSRPVPRLLPVDGVLPSLSDIDLTRACLAVRPDIVLLGDSGGFMTAAEAQLQPRLLVRSWLRREAIDLRDMGRIPLMLHGRPSLTFTGPDWTLLRGGWQEVDFRLLGWSKANGLDGKLWYLADARRGVVEAVHIYHEHAAELASTAAALMSSGVTDPVWFNCAPHPSAAEIFQIVAGQVLAAWGEASPGRLTPLEDVDTHRFVFPGIADLGAEPELPGWLPREHFVRAMLSSTPERYLMAVFAASKIDGRKTGAFGIDPEITSIETDCGRFSVEPRDGGILVAGVGKRIFVTET